MHLQATPQIHALAPINGLAHLASAPEQKSGEPGASIRPIIEQTVADVFGVDAEQLRLPTRGEARVALARQVAMYVAHVGCGASLTEVGELFGRDRTTVSHACSVVEKRRDRADFDHAIELVEVVVRVLIGSSSVRPQRTVS